MHDNVELDGMEESRKDHQERSKRST